MKLKELVEKYGEYDVVLSKREATNEILIEGRKPKPKTVLDLEDGDRYFIVYPTGEIGDVKFSDCQNDYCVVSNGNAFLTKEDAEREVERRKVETLLLKYGGRRWFNETSENYYMYYDLDVIDCTNTYEIHYQGTIYFDTEGQAEKAVAEIGEERLKKALFEVR